MPIKVSTHSRLKAAGFHLLRRAVCTGVSTHSRLKAAGGQRRCPRRRRAVSTHSRLKAAGPGKTWFCHCSYVSTHSRLKAAGRAIESDWRHDESFNTQPPEGGWLTVDSELPEVQVSTHSRLKAAGSFISLSDSALPVSTHSRLKAAGFPSWILGVTWLCFNTQPPEGGWFHLNKTHITIKGFNTQPPEGGWRLPPPPP